MSTFSLGFKVFKCLGFLYKSSRKFISSYYLVMEKNASIKARPGDVLVSNQSNGFLERVTAINTTVDSLFIHTEFLRCTEKMNIPSRYVLLKHNYHLATITAMDLCPVTGPLQDDAI